MSVEPTIELPTYEYKTYQLDPSNPNFIFLAGKYAAISLRALTTDPESFTTAYSTEGALGVSEFLERLSRPDLSVFICVGHPASLPAEKHDIEHGIWVGMVTQIGPTPKKTFWLPESGTSEPLDDNLETKFHQTATWVDPAHRGKELSKQIIQAAVASAAETLTGDVEQVRIRAFRSPANQVSKGLYGSLGFPTAGKCTITEVMIGNGNPQYPFHGRTDWGDERMNTRMGIVMEKVVRKSNV
jgi:GNAT superfamily N-acetyltransferase